MLSNASGIRFKTRYLAVFIATLQSLSRLVMSRNSGALRRCVLMAAKRNGVRSATVKERNLSCLKPSSRANSGYVGEISCSSIALYCLVGGSSFCRRAVDMLSIGFAAK
jgi:hypothetical protein